MVEIFSKRDGPGREEAHFRKVLQENRSTIVRLADQLSQGGYSASKKPKAMPEAEGLIIHVGSGTPKPEVPKPYVRVSHNGRVIVMDLNSGRQLEFLGELRRYAGGISFILATYENGFFSPLADNVADVLFDLDGMRIDADFTETQLCEALAERLIEREPAQAGADIDRGTAPDGRGT